jgi:hypothetical protein
VIVLAMYNHASKLIHTSHPITFFTFGFLHTERWTSHSRTMPPLPSLFKMVPMRFSTYSCSAGVKSMLFPVMTKETSPATSELMKRAVDDEDDNSDGSDDDVDGREGVLKAVAINGNRNRLVFRKFMFNVAVADR